MDQRMRIRVEHHADLRAAPRSLYRGERRIDIIEIMDQWYGPGYRYVKVRRHDSSVYILLFDEIRDQWELIMFSTAIAQRLATRAASPARSASLVNKPFSDLGARRPHFENDVVLTRVITLRPESSFDRVEI